jgi:hypothetical protein
MAINNQTGMDSKFMKIFLTVVSVFLMFVGPTYVPYLLADVLNVDYIASISLGAVLFIVGLVALIFLVRQKVVE